MAKTKTFPTGQDVTEFITWFQMKGSGPTVSSLLKMMEAITGLKPYMWGPTIIGFGNYHYKYASGHEGDAPIAGFSPRKNAICLYFESSFPGRDALLKQFGEHKAAVACVCKKP